MKKLLAIVLLGSMLTACAEDEHTKYVKVPATPSPLTDVQQIVKDENEYRLGLGQTALTEGLSCVLYTVTGGDRIQASISGHNTLTGVSQVASFLYSGPFNQPDAPISDGLNVLPEPLKSLYKNMYLLRCQGQVVVTQTGYFQFDLLSDDGSVLYVDGAKVVDLDNAHGTILGSGFKYLRRGVHSLRLDYAQTGGGSESLVLKANGSSIPSENLYH